MYEIPPKKLTVLHIDLILLSQICKSFNGAVNGWCLRDSQKPVNILTQASKLTVIESFLSAPQQTCHSAGYDDAFFFFIDGTIVDVTGTTL